MCNLAEDGDQFEQENCERIREILPRYEQFWREHLVPLRRPNSIRIRPGIDPNLEQMAQCHYTSATTLVSVRNRMDSSDTATPNDVFLDLCRAAENALKTVEAFRSLYRECTHQVSRVSTQSIESAAGKVLPYRNRVHESLLGEWQSEDGERLVPKLEYLERYKLWSSLETADPQHMIRVQQLYSNMYQALRSAMCDAWDGMLSESPTLLESSSYRALLAANPSRAPGREYTETLLSSNTQDC